MLDFSNSLLLWGVRLMENIICDLKKRQTTKTVIDAKGNAIGA